MNAIQAKWNRNTIPNSHWAQPSPLFSTQHNTPQKLQNALVPLSLAYSLSLPGFSSIERTPKRNNQPELDDENKEF